MLVRVMLQAEAKRHMRAIENYFEEERKAYIKRMNVPDVRLDIEQAAMKALGDIEILAGKWELDAIRTEYADKLNDYNRFKERNRLDREPYYPKSKLRHSLWAIAVVILETIINSELLAVGEQSGLIGGFFLALMIALVNVGAAFAAGYIARFINVRSATRRAFGFLFVLLLCPCFFVLLNLLVAHYRDAVLAGLASGGYVETLESGKRAVESFLESWFGVSGFRSWLLSGMGMIAAVVGAWKGYSMEDPYPGYGRRHRARNDALDNLQKKRREVVHEIDKIREEGFKSINSYHTHFKNSRMAAESTRGLLLALPRRLRWGREDLLLKIELLQSMYCPNEKPVTLDAPLPELKAPNTSDIDPAMIEECVRAQRQKLIDRCSLAVSGSQATS